MKWVDSLRAKREKKLQDAHLNEYGILIGDISSSNFNAKTGRLFVCLVRSLLIFLASLGTLGAVVSAVGLSYNPFIVIPAFIILSIFISFLYYNKVCFYVGYVFFFISFTVSIFSLYWYINSGFQAFINVLYEKYSDYFALSTLREATEFISDRTLTVSVAMIFVGSFLAILLNITISGYMSLIETFLITFPILQIVLYIDLKPNTIYLVMLISVYITVSILRRSSYYRIPAIGKSKTNYVTLKNKRKNSWLHTYITNSRGLLTVALYSVLFAGIFLVLCNNNFFNSFNSKSVTNKLKNTTDEYVKIFVQEGVWGLLNRYNNIGGLNSGQIGGVGSVRPDYETDLEVTYVPLDTATVYLKGYCGVYYSGNRFATNYEYGKPNSPYRIQSYYCLNEYLHPTGNYASMYIHNIDADPNFLYMPYDSIAYQDESSYAEASVTLDSHYPNSFSDHVGYFGKYMIELSENASESIINLTDDDYIDELTDAGLYGSGSSYYMAIYDPYVPNINYDYGYNIPEEYESAVYAECLQVPEELQETLDNFIDEASLESYKGLIENIENDSDKAAVILDAAAALKLYYYREIPYTMAPGATPRNRDAIEFFLTDQRRGFCAHFAASAALILRELGIPTRYCEGYAIQFSDLNDNAMAVNADMNDWLDITDSSSYALYDETGLVTVEVSDAQAHAWVEIYLDGYGWIPYEFTPPSTEDTIQDFSLAGLFSGLFRTAGPINTQATGNDNAYEINTDLNLSISLGFIYKPLIIVICIIILVILMRAFGPQLIALIKASTYEKNGHFSKAMAIKYHSFAKLLARRKLIASRSIMIREVLDALIASDHINSMEYQQMYLCISMALYGFDELSSDDYNACLNIFKRVNKATQK